MAFEPDIGVEDDGLNSGSAVERNDRAGDADAANVFEGLHCALLKCPGPQEQTYLGGHPPAVITISAARVVTLQYYGANHARSAFVEDGAELNHLIRGAPVEHLELYLAYACAIDCERPFAERTQAVS